MFFGSKQVGIEPLVGQICLIPAFGNLSFVALLWSTVGPTEKWLQLLGTLLSAEHTPRAGNEAEETSVEFVANGME